MERLKASWLPDFTKKIDMLEAAKLFKKAIDRHCRASAQDPNWETNMVTAREQHGGDYSDKIICVNWEAGPFDWGVSYSLGSHPGSYSMHKNTQDWYLETYWGFDVMFTPIEFEKAPRFYNKIVHPPMSDNFMPKYTCEKIVEAYNGNIK